MFAAVAPRSRPSLSSASAGQSQLMCSSITVTSGLLAEGQLQFVPLVSAHDDAVPPLDADEDVTLVDVPVSAVLAVSAMLGVGFFGPSAMLLTGRNKVLHRCGQHS